MVGIFLTSQRQSDIVDTVCASWRLPPLAAVLYSDTALLILEEKTAALISQKPPFMNRRMKIPLLYDGFFSFAVVRQIHLFLKLDNLIDEVSEHRLIYAGSYDTKINFFIADFCPIDGLFWGHI